MTYYIYTLSINDVVIYIGRSSNIWFRYRQHYAYSATSDYLRYHLVEFKEIAKMTIVFYSKDNEQAKTIERLLIKMSFKAKRKLFNSARLSGIKGAIQQETSFRVKDIAGLKLYDLINKGISNVNEQIKGIADNYFIPFYNLIPFNNVIKLLA